MNKNKNLKSILSYLLRDSGFDWDRIERYIDALFVEVELVKLPMVFGFANDKIYIDFLNIFRYEKKYETNGHMALYVLLHEVGHMLRLYDSEELRDILNGDDFEAYFNSVLIEEKAVHEYAIKMFKKLTGENISEIVLRSEPDIHSSDYRNMMLQTFERKQILGGWNHFINEMVDRDYVWRTKEISWNTMYDEEERMVRCCINGDFYNPFDSDFIKSRRIMCNPFTFEILRTNGDSIDDFTEKNLININPINARYISKASYENGKIIEAYKVEDDKWVEVNLNTL